MAELFPRRRRGMPVRKIRGISMHHPKSSVITLRLSFLRPVPDFDTTMYSIRNVPALHTGRHVRPRGVKRLVPGMQAHPKFRRYFKRKTGFSVAVFPGGERLGIFAGPLC